MLNELHSLSETLNEQGIETVTWHREYKKLPKARAKAPCYRIWLTESGEISGISPLESETVSKLRKYGNNQSAFPAFNIKPLFRTTADGQSREDNWLKSMKKIDKSLEIISEKFSCAISDADGDTLGIARKLVEATQKLTQRGLRGALEEYLVSIITDDKNELHSILEFCGSDSKSPENDMGANISVIFDLSEWRKYGYPIASEEMTVAINTALVQQEIESSSVQQPTRQDAFGRPFDETVSEPMPEVKLSGFGVTLRSMFKGQPCQKRYGRFDDASYPVSKLSRNAAKEALEWAANEKSERVTWVKADRNEIVFAYPSALPEIAIEFAAMFGGIGAEERFEDLAQDFLRVFRGLPPSEQPEYIRVFSIRKMDKARSKVVFTRNLSPEGFIKAAELWQTGCRNVPEDIHAEQKIPFPLDVAKIVNAIWRQEGSQVKRKDGAPIVKRMQAYEGIELMLDTCADTARNYLCALVQNAFGLVVFSGNKSFSSKYHSEQAARTMSILGLLLYKCGYRKEDYMKDTAFLVGRLLKISDELHVRYCIAERKGEIARDLAGASMLAVAVDTPDKALAQLCLRMKPYIIWAKRYRQRDVDKENIEEEKKEQEEKDINLAGWLLWRYEITAAQLQATLIEPIRLHDFEKAQLFLGYLASLTESNSNEQEEHKIQSEEGENNND